MYEFKDAMDKVKFDEKFTDVADNIKRDCQQLTDMSFSDSVNKINQWIDKVFNVCNCSVINYPEWFRIVVWRVIYNQLKANPNNRQTDIIEENLSLPKDVFGKKYWNMYSPDMKIQQEKYHNLQLPFHYAQVECNSIYRAMIHHLICSAEVRTDTIIDVFGKMGLVPALCANGYKYKKVFVNKHDYDILTKLQPMLSRKLRIYKQIEKVQKYLKSETYAEQKVKVEEILGLAGTLFSSYIEEEMWEKYDTDFIVAYFFMYTFFVPEYWIESSLEVYMSKKIKEDNGTYEKERGKYLYDKWVSQWINEGRGLRERIYKFLDLTKNDFFMFIDEFRKIIFLYDESEIYEDEYNGMSVIRELANTSDINTIYDLNEEGKEFLYIDMPKYITEYERFHFSGSDAKEVLEMLDNYKGEWILTWKTFVEIDRRYKDERLKKEDTDIKSIRDRLYTQKRPVTDEVYENDLLMVKENEIDFKELYDLLDLIDNKCGLYVFDYRDNIKNKSQSIVFITNIDFEEIDDTQFQQRYNLNFAINKGHLRKRLYKDFFKEMKKWLI